MCEHFQHPRALDLRRLRSLVLLITICAPVFVFGPPSACSEEPRSEETSNEPLDLAYHSAVSEVRLVFFATDEQNHNVLTLQKDDFAVIDDERVIRQFRSFTRSDTITLDLVVLIDSSESVMPQFPQEVAEVAQLISHSPWNPGDTVSVLSFAGLETHLICAVNCRTSFSANLVAPLVNRAATPLLEALDAAATLLIQRRQPDVWPVILLFSDGIDNISKISFLQVQRKILASGAQVYAIDVDDSKSPSTGRATLKKLADDSGGRYMRLDNSARLFQDLLDDLRSARLVTYALPASGSGFHSVRILPTRNLKLQFRCRRGYYLRSDNTNPEEGR